MDLDYFNNKKLAALKIPKQFLNFDSSEGLGNGTSLTKISSRYAHTIMRIQNAYAQGITNLINYFFLDKGLDYVNKFTVKMVSPGTVEDNERAERLNSQISQCGDIMNLVSNLDDDKQLQVLKTLFSTKLNMNDVAEIIDTQIGDEDEEANLETDYDVSDTDSHFEHSHSDNSMGDLGQPSFDNEPMKPSDIEMQTSEQSVSSNDMSNDLDFTTPSISDISSDLSSGEI